MCALASMSQFRFQASVLIEKLSCILLDGLYRSAFVPRCAYTPMGASVLHPLCLDSSIQIHYR